MPTYNIAGIPIRVEDLVLISILVFQKSGGVKKEDKRFITILYLLPIISLLSIFIQILKGYVPVLGDLNSIFSLIRNIIIFYAGFILGPRIKVKPEKLLLGLSIGFLICALASIIQYYNLGGVGNQLFLVYAEEEGLKFGLSRAVGTTGNPNYAAFFQINAFIIFLLIKPKNNFLKVLNLLLLTLLVISVYVTFSRTGLICIILLLLSWLVIHKKYIILLLIGFFTLASLPFIAEASENTRFQTLFTPDKYDANGNVFTLNGRIDGIWGQKLQYFFDNPILGISSAKGLRSNTNFEIVTFDNSFIYMMVTGGLLGFLLHMIFHYRLVTRFWKTGRLIDSYFFNFLLLIHLNIAVFYFTTDLIKMVQFTTFYFFMTGILLTYKRQNETTNNNTNSELEQS